MTLKHHQQITRARFANACTQARINHQPKPDWEQFKKQYNYYGTTTIINNPEPIALEPITHTTTQTMRNNVLRQEKALKQINITMKNVCNQADLLDDFFQELAEKHPEYKTFHKLSDYIFGSLLDIQEKLQTL